MSKGKLRILRANVKSSIALGRDSMPTDQIYTTDDPTTGTKIDGVKATIEMSPDLTFIIVKGGREGQETENWIPISNVASITLIAE